MITEITMHHIKGQNRVQKLTGRDIIQGVNGSGKTTCSQSIGLAMLGYVPGNGKTASETFKLASADTMTVDILLDTGFQFARTLTRNERENPKTFMKEVSISQDISVSPSMGERLNSEKEKRILEEIGNFPVMFDFNEFLALSDAKRRDFFYNMSPVKQELWDKTSIQGYLEELLLTDELRENNPDKYAIMTDVITKTMAMYPVRFNCQSGLTAMIDYVSKQLTAWKKDKVNSSGAVKKLSEIKNDLEETDRGIKNNKEELEQLQQSLLELSTQIAADTEKKKAIDLRNEELSELKEELNDVTRAECGDSIEELKWLIDTKKHQLIDFNESTIEHDKLVKEYEEIKQSINEANSKIVNSNNNITGYRSEIKAYMKNRDTVISQKGKCVIDSSIECNLDTAHYISELNANIKECETSIAKCDSDILDATANLKTINPIAAEKKNEIDRLIRQQKEDVHFNSDTNIEIVRLEGKIVAVEKFEETKALRIKSIENRIAALEREPIESIVDLDIATKQKEGLENQIRTLREKIEEQNKAKITLSNLQQSMIATKQATYHYDCYKSISDKLGPKGIQGEIVKSILNPIKVDIQDKLSALGIDKEFYFSTESDTGKEIFQFGWIDDGTERNFDALSTGEQLMLLIAMIIVIVERNNPRLKVLMIDNIENLDSRNFVNLLEGLNIVGGKLDNIIISGVIDLKSRCVSDYMGFRVWDLSPEVQP